MKLRRLTVMLAAALAVGLLTPGCSCTGEEEDATKQSAAQTSNNLATIEAQRAANANTNTSNSNALSGGLRSNNNTSNNNGTSSGVTENTNNTNARDASGS